MKGGLTEGGTQDVWTDDSVFFRVQSEIVTHHS